MSTVTLNIPGYHVLQYLETSSRRVVAKVREQKDNVQYILKVFKSGSDSMMINAGLDREKRLIEQFGIDSALESVRVYSEDGQVISVFKDFGNGTLRSLINEKKLSISDFFKWSLAIARALEVLHDNNINHMRLCPESILIDQDTHEVKLMDLESASLIDGEVVHSLSFDGIDADVNYISPEQTGRMNRQVDLRSNLYSLGCIFYEMLGGVKVFPKENMTEVIHCHLAHKPKPLIEVNQDVPPQLSRIIDKLLKKNAEERYNIIQGLIYDLQRCAEEYVQGSISEFDLGEMDQPDALIFPQKLYGREEEVKLLKEELHKTVHGAFSMLFVSGYSGIGKTKLVFELHRDITAYGGHFLSSKVDQLDRGIPYFGIITAIKDYINYLLTLDPEHIVDLVDEILKEIRGQGSLLIEVIPELELLIGPQSKLPKLPVAEARNRFQDALCRFMGSLANKNNPITLFIDDLQWADLASIQVLKRLAQYYNHHYIFLIGAYRDNEVDESHPLRITQKEMEDNFLPFKEIKLEPLSLDSIVEMFSDLFLRPKEEVKTLAELVGARTGSNPFFIKLFVQRLKDDGFIFFNNQSQHWEWDEIKVKQSGITDNVVELITEGLERLPGNSQKTLKYGACIGNQFDLETLRYICDLPDQDIAKALWIPLQKNIIIPLSSNYKNINALIRQGAFQNVYYKFAHDRAQQAAYNLLSKEDKLVHHLRIGRKILSQLDEKELELKIFDVVNHFNIGLSLVEDEDERKQIRELNRRAAHKAKRSSSFQIALPYFRQVVRLYNDQDWRDLQDEVAEAYLDLSECEYICGNHDAASKLYRVIFSKTSRQAHISKLYDIQLRQYAQLGRNKETLDLGARVLRKYGVSFKVEPSLLILGPELIRTKFMLSRRNIAALKDAPQIEDESMAFSIQTLMNIAATAYVYDNNTMLLLVLRMVQLSLKYGHADESAFGYGLFGFVEGAALGNAKQSKLFADLSMELIKDVEDPIIQAKVIFLRAFSTQHWFEPIKLALPELMKSFQMLDQSGSYTFACYSLQAHIAKRIYLGEEIGRVQDDLVTNLQYATKVKEVYTQNLLHVLRQYLSRLSGDVADEYTDDDFAKNEEAFVKELEDLRLLMPVAWHFVYNQMTYFLFEDYDRALEYTKKAAIVDDVAPTTMAQIEHHFYKVLIYAHLAKSKKSRLYRWKAKWSLRKLKNWAKDCPENFKSRYLLANLFLKMKSGTQVPVEDFSLIYASAHEQNDGFISALSLDFWGRYYLSKGDIRKALERFEKSIYEYRKYGAHRMAEFLEKKYFPSGFAKAQKSLDDIIDLETIMNASRVISGNIILEDLLNNLLKILVENAGAQKGFLLLNNDDELTVESAYDVDHNESVDSLPVPVKDAHFLSSAIINFVWRTHQHVLIGDAQSKSSMITDDYLRRNKIRSIMCLPIENNGEIRAIVYLENNAVTNAFSEGRMSMITLLASQAAISLENARLYGSLERKVEQRTSELAEQKKRADDLLLNMFPIEVAEELKDHGESKARLFEKATILFCDFKNFTLIAEKMSPDALVELLDHYFGAYDQIMLDNGMEKIKTIGDAYVAAGGLPNPEHGSPEDAIRSAMAIHEFNLKTKEKHQVEGKPFFEMRVGLHTGPVVAGVVGHTKFAYDIWGDTVNLAARMEQNGEINKINISGDTYALIKNSFNCSYRGKIEAKNKGAVDMYFVESEK